MASHCHFHALCLLVFITILHLATGGTWQNWQSWQDCTKSCGGGVKVRHRTCINPTCSGDGADHQACNYQECPRDGAWKQWTIWTTCTVSCGAGTQWRSRECDGPYSGGTPCVGVTEEIQTCNNYSCPVDGGWSEWSSLSSCPVTCGGGYKTKTRLCNNPEPMNNGRQCPGSTLDSQACNTQSCPDSSVVNGNWGPWSLVTDCTTTCGPGTRSRERSCTNPAPDNGGNECVGDPSEEFDCNVQPCPVDGAWGWWVAWSSCTAACEGGHQERYRNCDNPAPAYGGTNCSDSDPEDFGRQWQNQACNLQECTAVDGQWGHWAAIDTCSATCGGGHQVRIRSCDNPAPSNGGRKCPDPEPDNENLQSQHAVCNSKPCPVHGKWTSWSNFTDCSLTCGTGSRMRTRTCTDPPPAHNGLYCRGSATEQEDCGNPDCTVDGNWGPWSPFGPCTATCGGGTKSRLRNCDNPPPGGNGTDCKGEAEEILHCNNVSCPAVDGAWSRWSVWGTCSVSCGIRGGLRTRIRACDEPPPQHGGLDCSGLSTQSEKCNSFVCPTDPTPIDGKWTTWTEWTQCSQTCGSGRSRRARTCTNPAPSGGGRSCYHDHLITREVEILFCSTVQCPVDGEWSEWGEWAHCDVTCGEGRMARSRWCNEPKPAYGGRNCLGASTFSNFETQSTFCEVNNKCAGDTGGNNNIDNQPSDNSGTTPTPDCQQEVAYDDLKWPLTIPGETVSLRCPQGSAGTVYRKCGTDGVWEDAVTSKCEKEAFDNLKSAASSAHFNTTLLKETLDTFKTLCTSEQISLAGDLLACKIVFMNLVHMDFLADLKIDAKDKNQFVHDIFDGVNSVLDVANQKEWKVLVLIEENDGVSTAADFMQGMDLLGTQMADYLKRTGQAMFCTTRTNVEMCVDQLTCETSGFRYPKKPPDPTPPSKHIRGWEAPPAAKVSHLSVPDDLSRDASCSNGGTMAPKYSVGVAYKSLYLLMPDENKHVANVEVTDETVTTVAPYGDVRVVNADIISVSLISGRNTSQLSTPVTITMYHSKDGRDPLCTFIDLQDKKNLYSERGCRVHESAEHYTVCQCDHMTAFTLLTKPGKYPPVDDGKSAANPLILFTCVVGLLCHLCIVIVYAALKMYKRDKQFIIMNFAASVLVAELLMMAGGNATHTVHACRFVAFVIQWTVLAHLFWFLCMVAFMYKNLKNLKPMGFWRKLFYAGVGWGMPLFVAVTTIAMGHKYYKIDTFCWWSWDEATAVSFLIPYVLVILLILIVLIYSYRIALNLVPSSSTDDFSKDQLDLHQKKVYLRKLLVLWLLVLLTWASFAAFITPLFLVANFIMSIYTACIFCFLDDETQVALGNKRDEMKIARKTKFHRPDTPQDDPDWVKISKTRTKTKKFKSGDRDHMESPVDGAQHFSNIDRNMRLSTPHY